MTEPICFKCKKEVWADMLICSACNCAYHRNCTDRKDFSIVDQILVSCARCVFDVEKRKTSFDSKTLSGDDIPLKVTTSTTPSFLRPATFQNQQASQAFSDVNVVTGKTDVVRNIDQNDTLLAVLQKVACLPDLVTKVDNIEQKVNEVASLREGLLKMNEKLHTVSNT